MGNLLEYKTDKIQILYTGEFNGNKIETNVTLHLDKKISIFDKEYRQKTYGLLELFGSLV